jgi:hypothetical protein
VELFEQRAQAFNRALTAKGEVPEICRRFEGSGFQVALG